MTGMVRLMWRVDPAGYKIEPREHKPGTAGAAMHGSGVQNFIVPRSSSEKQRKYEAHLLEHEIFLHLINSARRPGEAGVLEFVEKWGLLSHVGMESLEWFQRRRDDFLDFFSGNYCPDLVVRLCGGLKSSLGPVHIRLQKTRGRPQFFFQPHTLLQFCVLEYVHTSTGGIDLKSCEACGALLRLPKLGRPARYCDDACKMAAYRDKNRDRINRNRRQYRAKQRSTSRSAGSGSESTRPTTRATRRTGSR